jgi:hypothetical protein
MEMPKNHNETFLANLTKVVADESFPHLGRNTRMESPETPTDTVHSAKSSRPLTVVALKLSQGSTTVRSPVQLLDNTDLTLPHHENNMR